MGAPSEAYIFASSAHGVADGVNSDLYSVTQSTSLGPGCFVHDDDTSPTMPKVLHKADIDRLGFRDFLVSVIEKQGGSTALDLSENAIGDQGVRVLREVLSGHPHLRRLNLHGAGFSFYGFQEVGSLLDRCPELHTLSLGHNSLDPGPLQKFPDAFCLGLKHAPALRVLNLNSCEITAIAIPSLCGVLCSPEHQLECLSLAGNMLDGAAAVEVISSLAENTTLHALDLGANRFGMKGGEAIAAGLAKVDKCALRRLDMERNELKLRGCQALLRLFATGKGPPLDRLDLRNNGVSEADCTELCKVVDRVLAPVLQLDGGARRILLSWPHRPARVVHSRDKEGRGPSRVAWD